MYRLKSLGMNSLEYLLLNSGALEDFVIEPMIASGTQWPDLNAFFTGWNGQG
jgi:hypothetical protein